MHFSFTLYKDTRTSVFSELGLFIEKILNDPRFYCCSTFPDFPDAQKLKSCKFYFLFSQLSLIVGDENSISGIEEQSFLLGPNSLTAFISFSLSFFILTNSR